ncbi:MAG: ABC transporter permease [Hyphomonadaceae bacterium]|nr:ABC transporter permease [Hyphomonadaceae bacterium]
MTPADASAATTPPATPLRARTSERRTLIRPDRGLFDLELDQIWRSRGLLATLVKRDIMVLYRQAALGAAWAVIQPIFAVIIFTIVFGIIAKIPTPGDVPYAIFAFAAVLPWNYFAESVRRGGTGLVTEEELVRKVYFPRLLIPLAGTIGPILDFLIGFVVLLILMAFFGIAPTWRLIAIPPLLVLAGMCALSISMWIGPINVRYRDVKHTLPFILQIWMYASPVVYSFSIVPDNLKWIVALNPMVGVIEAFRWAVFGEGVLDPIAIGVSGVLIVVLFFGGLVFFKRMERSFADLI